MFFHRIFFLDTGSQSSLNRLPQNFNTSLVLGQDTNLIFGNFSSTSKNFGGEKRQISNVMVRLLHSCSLFILCIMLR